MLADAHISSLGYLCCKEQCVPDKGILTYTLFGATPQQTDSLHLRMLLDPHNRQHLNSKTWKTLPSLFVRLISYDIKCASWRSYSGQSFDHICMWRVDMSGWSWHFVHLCWQTWPWHFKFLDSLGWIFREKLANYRPCSRISRNKIVISRITGYGSRERYSFVHDSRQSKIGVHSSRKTLFWWVSLFHSDRGANNREIYIT